MSDEVLRDCFRSMGLDHVTPFHVRALDAYRLGLEAIGWSGRPDTLREARQRGGFDGLRDDVRSRRVSHLADRLRHDLAFRELDGVWNAAIDEDNRRAAERARQQEHDRQVRARQLEIELRRREQRRKPRAS